MRSSSFLLFLFLFSSCGVYKSQTSYIKELKEKGGLVLLTRNSLTTYYSDKDNQWAGYEYELASQFAKYYDIPLKVKTVGSAQEAFSLLKKGEGDFIGAGLSSTKERAKNFRLSKKYLQVEQKLVCNRFGKKANSRSQMTKRRILVGSDTSYEETLKNLKKVIKDLDWEAKDISSEEILYEIHKKNYDCTIVDSNILALQQQLFPNLISTLNMSPKMNVHWFVEKHNYLLERMLNEWLDIHTVSVLQMQEKYFGYLQPKFDYYDAKIFKRRIQSHLPKWKKFFIKKAKKYDLDWRLLAAISYQESHWNQRAISPTGVRGLMMLTRATANRVGIKSRREPLQSIEGGAKYFSILKKQFSKKVKGEDLNFISLAAYNVGPGHIEDLIRYLEKKELNVSWYHIKKLLPFLTRKSFFEQLKYGYANGNEPLLYVDRVREFYKRLKIRFP